jgi:glutathionylspermidine synthase
MKDILIEANNGTRAVCIEGRFYGWVFLKHPDGQWVTQRKASQHEIEQAKIIHEFNKFISSLSWAMFTNNTVA